MLDSQKQVSQIKDSGVKYTSKRKQILDIISHSRQDKTRQSSLAILILFRFKLVYSIFFTHRRSLVGWIGGPEGLIIARAYVSNHGIRYVESEYMKCSNKSIEGKKKAILTGICQRNRFRVNISEEPADRRKNGQQDRAGGANDHGVEDGGFLVGGPAEVAEGGRPELRLRHCDGLVGSCRAVEFRGFPSCLWRDSGRKRSIEPKRVTGDKMLRFARFPFPVQARVWE